MFTGASLAFKHQMPVAYPYQVTEKNVSRHCQMSPVGGGGANSSPVENHHFRVISRNVLFLANAQDEGVRQPSLEETFSCPLKFIRRTLRLGSSLYPTAPETGQPERRSSCSVMLSASGWLLSPCISHLILTSCASLPMDFDKAQCGRP